MRTVPAWRARSRAARSTSALVRAERLTVAHARAAPLRCSAALFPSTASFFPPFRPARYSFGQLMCGCEIENDDVEYISHHDVAAAQKTIREDDDDEDSDSDDDELLKKDCGKDTPPPRSLAVPARAV